jgi:hypothetical protein
VTEIVKITPTPDEKLSRFTTNRLERDLGELITFLPSP